MSNKDEKKGEEGDCEVDDVIIKKKIIQILESECEPEEMHDVILLESKNSGDHNNDVRIDEADDLLNDLFIETEEPANSGPQNSANSNLGENSNSEAIHSSLIP